MKINILIKAAFHGPGHLPESNPAVIEVPGTGIRLVSGNPHSKEDADRINAAIQQELVRTNPRTGQAEAFDTIP